jgi:hypothetical protein
VSAPGFTGRAVAEVAAAEAELSEAKLLLSHLVSAIDAVWEGDWDMGVETSAQLRSTQREAFLWATDAKRTERRERRQALIDRYDTVMGSS